MTSPDDGTGPRNYDLAELERAQRDADELVSALCREQNAGLLHSMLDGYRTAAENLVSQGWTRLGPGERVVSAKQASAYRLAEAALRRWEELKKEVRESAEVSADASELTSGVKPENTEAQILAAFARSSFALTRVEACDKAAAQNVDSVGGSWDRWRDAFRELLARRLIVSLPGVGRNGEPLYILTEAGRSLHKLDGVDR